MAEERRMAEDRRNERCDGQCATEGGAGAHGAETPPRGGSGLTPEVVVPDRELGAYRRKMRLIEFTHSSTRATVPMSRPMCFTRLKSRCTCTISELTCSVR